MILLNNSKVEMLSICALEMGVAAVVAAVVVVYISVAQFCMFSSSLYGSNFSSMPCFLQDR